MPDSSSQRRGSASSTASSSSSSSSAVGLDLFQEPASFRPATPPPTQAFYDPPLSPPALQVEDVSSPSPKSERVTLNLVGSHPLWGHHLWNAAPTMSDYLIRHRHQLLLRPSSSSSSPTASRSKAKGSNVLELGAAAGLPSIISSRYGAQRVVSTDWPDPDLVGNLAGNLSLNGVKETEGRAMGFIWGADPAPLLECLADEEVGDSRSESRAKFDVILLSDLVFNHMAHHSLLDSMEACISLDGGDAKAQAPVAVTSTSAPPPNHDTSTPIDLSKPCGLCFFTHHRPHLAQEDMRFFDRASKRGWTCTKLGEWKMEPMFKDDPGPAEVRGTVHGWHMAWDGVKRQGAAQKEREDEAGEEEGRKVQGLSA